MKAIQVIEPFRVEIVDVPKPEITNPDDVIIRVFTPAVIFGEGLCALLCSCLLSNIFVLVEGKR